MFCKVLPSENTTVTTPDPTTTMTTTEPATTTAMIPTGCSTNETEPQVIDVATAENVLPLGRPSEGMTCYYSLNTQSEEMNYMVELKTNDNVSMQYMLYQPDVTICLLIHAHVSF